MAQPVTGDFGIITVLTIGDTERIGDGTTKHKATKRTGKWVKVSAKKSSGGAFGDLPVGEMFFTYPQDDLVGDTGDKWYDVDEEWFGFAVNFSINYTQPNIDVTPLGAREPRNIPGRVAVDATINAFLEEGVQGGFGAGEELPTFDIRHIKSNYMKLRRFERDATNKKTKGPVLATGNANQGVFDISKRTNPIMFYSIAADVDVNTVAAYYAPKVSWGGFSFGSGEAGSRSDFSLPVTFQHDEYSNTLIGYEFTYSTA